VRKQAEATRHAFEEGVHCPYDKHLARSRTKASCEMPERQRVRMPLTFEQLHSGDCAPQQLRNAHVSHALMACRR
jgi:hypothetical protein